MDIVNSILIIYGWIILQEVTNYLISLKEPDFRAKFCAQVPLNILTVCLIVLINDTLYFVFLRRILELTGITKLFILSLVIGLVETFSVYYNLCSITTKFQYLSCGNRLVFNALIFYQLLQLNIFCAVITHFVIIYACTVVRSNYPHADYYIKPILNNYTTSQETIKTKHPRENICAK
jgi:hypothetical protein